MAFESGCEFWKPFPALAPDGLWSRLSMLVSDLNVMGLENNKTSYLAWLANRLEEHPLPQDLPPLNPNLVK